MTIKKDPSDLQVMGRPTAYKPEYAKQARKYCLLGATDIQLADFFEVCEKTIYTWKQKNPDFLQATKRGKVVADANVAERLYQRAMGYTHDEEKIFQYEGQPVRVKTKKHYPPDTQAASLWLRNRQPDKWRDRTDITVRKPEEEMVPTRDLLKRNEELAEEIKILEGQL